MSPKILPEGVRRLASLVGPDQDEVLEAMEQRAREEEFPTVGAEVGRWLAVLARTTDARRIFEFGSGFGYSAYWFGRELPADGEVILTEIDQAELALAREYFKKSGMASRAQFEHGDAIETVQRYDGPFDIVLIDNEKHRYVEALDAVRGKLGPGSLVLADNAVTAGHIDRADVAAMIAGEDVPEATTASNGIAAYLSHIHGRADLETALLPLGEGVAVSVVR